VVVFPAWACATILTASSSEIRQQKSRLRRLGPSNLIFMFENILGICDF